MYYVKPFVFLCFFLANFWSISIALESKELTLDSVNVLYPTDNIITSGQPTIDDIKVLKKVGVTLVINLRPESEKINFDEKKVVEKLGMTYINIPVKGAGGITQKNAEVVDEILNKNPGKSFVHCASGNRVGGIFAMRAFHIENKSIDESLKVGESFGLTTLAPSVRSGLLESQSRKNGNHGEAK